MRNWWRLGYLSEATLLIVLDNILLGLIDSILIHRLLIHWLRFWTWDISWWLILDTSCSIEYFIKSRTDRMSSNIILQLVECHHVFFNLVFLDFLFHSLLIHVVTHKVGNAPHLHSGVCPQLRRNLKGAEIVMLVGSSMMIMLMIMHMFSFNDTTQE